MLDKKKTTAETVAFLKFSNYDSYVNRKIRKD